MQYINFDRIPAFYHNYIRQVKSYNIKEAFNNHLIDISGLLKAIEEDKWNFRYAVDKWTIKEVVQHIIDAERIFNYRALCIARGENASLPGFDENTYAAQSKANNRSKQELMEELEAVQKATVLLFNSFDEEQLQSEGTANGKTISVKAIGFICIGHVLHHKKIMEERYLPEQEAN